MITRATIGPLLVPGLRKIMFDDYMKVPNNLEKLFNPTPSTRSFEEWVGISGVGLSEEKAEGVGTVYKDITMLTPKRVTMTTWTNGMRCTMEAKQDDQYNQLAKLASILGKSFPVRREVERANIFNGSMGTWYATGQDGLALCSTAHPIKGTTYANPPTSDVTGATPPARTTTTGTNRASAADLDYTSLVDLTTLSMRQVDEQGDFIAINPRYLVCASENWAVANELLKSQMRPDTANNSISAVNSLGLEVVTSPYLLDPDAFFLLSSDNDLNWFNRMAFATSTEDDFDTGDTKIKGVERWGLGFADWRGIVGNPGI